MRRFSASTVAVAATLICRLLHCSTAHAQPKPSTVPAGPEAPATPEDEVGLPSERSAHRGHRSTIPTHLDDGQYRTHIATDHILEVGVAALGAKRGNSEARPGYAGLFAYQVDNSYHRDLDPLTGEHERKTNGENRLELSAMFGAMPGYKSDSAARSKTRYVGSAGISAGLGTGNSGMRLDGDADVNARYKRYAGFAAGVVSLDQGRTALKAGLGAGALGFRDRDIETLAGVIGRIDGRTWIGPNLALQFGSEAGWYFNDNTPDPETGIPEPGIKANRQTGYLKVRLSTDRNSNGLLYYVEPHAVFERTQIKVTGEPESTDRGITGIVSVGVAGMGL